MSKNSSTIEKSVVENYSENNRDRKEDNKVGKDKNHKSKSNSKRVSNDHHRSSKHRSSKDSKQKSKNEDTHSKHKSSKTYENYKRKKHEKESDVKKIKTDKTSKKTSKTENPERSEHQPESHHRSNLSKETIKKESKETRNPLNEELPRRSGEKSSRDISSRDKEKCNPEKPVSLDNQAYMMRRSLRFALKVAVAEDKKDQISTQSTRSSKEYPEYGKPKEKEEAISKSSQISKPVEKVPEIENKNQLASNILDYLDDIKVEDCKLHSKALASIDWETVFENPKVTVSEKKVKKINIEKTISFIRTKLTSLSTWNSDSLTQAPTKSDLCRDKNLLQEAISNFTAACKK